MAQPPSQGLASRLRTQTGGRQSFSTILSSRKRYIVGWRRNNRTQRSEPSTSSINSSKSSRRLRTTTPRQPSEPSNWRVNPSPSGKSGRRFLVLTARRSKSSREHKKMSKTSKAELLASLPEAEREALLSSLTPQAIASLKYDWAFWARPDQLPPEGDWDNW